MLIMSIICVTASSFIAESFESFVKAIQLDSPKGKKKKRTCL